jgi:hypothetical protein
LRYQHSNPGLWSKHSYAFFQLVFCVLLTLNHCSTLIHHRCLRQLITHSRHHISYTQFLKLAAWSLTRRFAGQRVREINFRFYINTYIHTYMRFTSVALCKENLGVTWGW